MKALLVAAPVVLLLLPWLLVMAASRIFDRRPCDLLLHPVGLIAAARAGMAEFAQPEVAVQINNQPLTMADVVEVQRISWQSQQRLEQAQPKLIGPPE